MEPATPNSVPLPLKSSLTISYNVRSGSRQKSPSDLTRPCLRGSALMTEPKSLKRWRRFPRLIAMI